MGVGLELKQPSGAESDGSSCSDLRKQIKTFPHTGLCRVKAEQALRSTQGYSHTNCLVSGETILVQLR